MKKSREYIVRAKKTSVHNEYYKSHKWREYSKNYLLMNPFCSCGHPSQHTHHKTPMSKGGEQYDINNLQAMCVKCHMKWHKENK